MNNLLALMGVGAWKRNIVADMDIRERYELTRDKFRITRHTLYSDSDDTYRLAPVVQDAQDAVLGAVRVSVHVSADRHMIQTTMTRVSDRAVSISTRRINADDLRHIIYSVNFTLSDGKKAFAVRYFNK